MLTAIYFYSIKLPQQAAAVLREILTVIDARPPYNVCRECLVNADAQEEDSSTFSSSAENDVDWDELDSIEEILQLISPNSTLDVTLDVETTAILNSINVELSQDADNSGRPFILSDCRITLGPIELYAFALDEFGRETPVLVDVSQIALVLGCDNYGGTEENLNELISRSSSLRLVLGSFSDVLGGVKTYIDMT